METIARTTHLGREQGSHTTGVALQGPACEPSPENVPMVDKSVKLSTVFVDQLVGERSEGWLNGGSFLTFHSGYASVHIFRRCTITFHGV